MLVENYTDGRLLGTVVHEDGNESVKDPIALFRDLGYARIEGLTGAPIEVREEESHRSIRRHLVSDRDPVATILSTLPRPRSRTIFSFPKLNAPGGSLEPVPAGGGLLDHEVELGFVSLEPIRKDLR